MWSPEPAEPTRVVGNAERFVSIDLANRNPGRLVLPPLSAVHALQQELLIRVLRHPAGRAAGSFVGSTTAAERNRVATWADRKQEHLAPADHKIDGSGMDLMLLETFR